jgi:hypothetical protein
MLRLAYIVVNISTAKATHDTPNTARHRRVHSTDFAVRVRTNQERLASLSNRQYNLVVCGAGSSGSVVARRLGENPKFRVCAAGGRRRRQRPTITEANKWPTNIGSASETTKADPGAVIRRCEQPAPRKPTQKEAIQ